MAKIQLTNVAKHYGSVVAVSDFNLTIEDGEFVVFVGPSGCGKSTTLRMIAGLESITSGTLMIGDSDVTNLPPKDRNVAMVFQNYALYPHKSVYDNMAFGLKVRGHSMQEIDEKVRRAADFLGITDLLKRKPKALSGGQMQRVALGRALVRDPEVFLLDEPLSNLDAKMRVRMRTEIASLHQRVATSMVYVTHDQVEAMTLGDRIVVMKDGFIQQVGAPVELYDYPANAFVGGFIGSPEMNLIDGTVTGTGPAPAFQHPDLTLPLAGVAAAAEHTLMLDQQITIGMRPEHLTWHAPNSAAPDGAIPVRIALVEQMGAQTLLVCKAGGTDMTALLTRNDQVRIGDQGHVSIDPQHVHVFDTPSGNTLRPGNMASAAA
ncbi:MAG: ABC transporter ATP-binding protein [Pseudomonadota bacterium]